MKMDLKIFLNFQLFPYPLSEYLQKGKSFVLKQDLLNLIEQKRAELIQIAIKYGLSSTSAIKCSQELDNLLNEYNRKYIKKISLS